MLRTRFIQRIGVVAASVLIAACGGDGDDALGEQAQEAAEVRADALDQAADSTSGAAEDALEAQADATRAEGEAREESIDDADVDADEMTAEQTDALVEGR